ncbi:MAG: phosphatase PAP2 family protein, partial [Chloroflexota bacterium]|nr:phosphatase PAP2 family protein [Chloroflexota bacterium]
LLGDAFVKPLVARPRPSAGLVRVYEPADSYGFPSTTTLVACVLFGIVTYFVWYARESRSVPRSATRRVLAIVATAALLLLLWISISRVYLGVHWATDILGAWLFGGAWLLLLVAAHRWWLTRRTKA